MGTRSPDAQRTQRLLVTVLVPLAAFLAGYIPLPFVDLRPLMESGAIDDPIANLFNLPPRQMGVLSLGLSPLLSAFIVVEWAALIVPRWRSLRVGGPEGRRRLFKATLILCFIFAVIQAMGVTNHLQQMEFHTASVGVFRFTTILSLLAGTFVMLAAAIFIDARGLAVGIAALLAGEIFANFGSAIPAILASRDFMAPGHTVVVIGLQVAVAVVIARLLLANRKQQLNDGIHLPLPASGFAPPVTIAASLLMFPATLANFGVMLPGADGLNPGSTTYRVIYMALVAAFVVGMSFAFNWPRRVAEVYARMASTDSPSPEAIKPVVIKATWQSFLLLAGVLGALWYSEHLTPMSVYLSASSVALAVAGAFVVDVLEEWRARAAGELVAVWPLHRVYAVSPVLRALKGVGIEAHVRGQYHRSLLQFFGPYVPMQVLVSPTDVDVATEILNRLLPDDATPDEAAGKVSDGDAAA